MLNALWRPLLRQYQNGSTSERAFMAAFGAGLLASLLFFCWAPGAYWWVNLLVSLFVMAIVYNSILAEAARRNLANMHDRDRLK